MAAEAAPGRAGNGLSWFPDWTGECVAIVASGPSTKKADVASLQGRLRVVAIKKNVELCPWADVVYGCDPAWWQSVQGLPDYTGLKISWVDGGARYFPDVRPVEIEKFSDDLLLDKRGTIGAGGNSAFQAVNLAIQFGARGILLIGCDMNDRGGAHWYGRNNWYGANNPTEDNFRRWHKAFSNAARTLSSLDVQVFNASDQSTLKCFPRKSIEETLSGWGL